VEEVPGVNAQAPTREELMEDLRSALAEVVWAKKSRVCVKLVMYSKRYPLNEE
jgi:hypothetical protein